MASCRNISYAVAVVPHADGTSFISGYKQALGNRVAFIDAVDGRNQTATIAALLESGIKFGDTSRGGRSWGKLATFLTKLRLLKRQLDDKLPWQVILEDDVILYQPAFEDYVSTSCRRMQSDSRIDLSQLSKYAEILLTSLQGARKIVSKIEELGMLKNDDHQLLDSKVMGTVVHTDRSCAMRCYGPKKYANSTRPFTIGRLTNHGDIAAAQKLTWAEVALLRILTRSPRAAEPLFGLLPGAEVGQDPYWRERKAKKAATRKRRSEAATLRRHSTGEVVKS